MNFIRSRSVSVRAEKTFAFAILIFVCSFQLLRAQIEDDSGRPEAVANPNAARSITNFKAELRLPVSFREHPQGLEIVALHDPLQRQNLASPGSPTPRASFDVGDVLTTINGQRVQNLDELFQQYRSNLQPLPVSVLNIRNTRIESWDATCEQIEASVGFPKEQANGEGKIVIIHLVDTLAAKIGPNLEKNVEHMRNFVNQQIAPERLKNYIVLQGEQCSADSIIKELARLPIDRQDTLLLYFQGHGAYDPNYALKDPSAGFFLDFRQLDIWRHELLRAMQAKGARLTILISDACNVKSTMDRVPKAEMRQEMRTVEGWTAIEELLLCYSGTLDLSAVSRGQLAWSTSDVGGWFTTSFIAALESSTGRANNSWSSVWNTVKINTHQFYSSRRAMYGRDNEALLRQKTMAPQEFVWDLTRNDPPNRPSETRSIPVTVTVELQ